MTKNREGKEGKPGLRLIVGTDPKPEAGRSGNRTESGLTVKQEQFAQGLAEGLSISDAYRRAYNTENMKPATIHSEGSLLAARPEIDARVMALLAEKKSKHRMLTGRQEERVWSNVWRLAEGENVPPSVQQAALALAAKMAGMLTDRVEVKTEQADSKSIEAELLQRLQRLAG